MIEYYDFDLPAAVTRGLQELIGENEPTGLNLENLDRVRRTCVESGTKRGVYTICWGTHSMYVGKADKLPERLTQHLNKLAGRSGIPMGEIGFKAILLHKNWSTSANEKLLIDSLKAVGQCAWNGMGFGPKDTGGKRDDSKPNAFDVTFPVNHELTVDGLPAVLMVSDLVAHLKRLLPFTFRHDKAILPGASADAEREIRPEDRTAWSLVKQLATVLGPDWQATSFANRITLFGKRTAFENAIETYP